MDELDKLGIDVFVMDAGIECVVFTKIARRDRSLAMLLFACMPRYCCAALGVSTRVRSGIARRVPMLLRHRGIGLTMVAA